MDDERVERRIDSANSRAVGLVVVAVCASPVFGLLGALRCWAGVVLT